MCPHGYHHSGSMASPALGTRDVYIHIYIHVNCMLINLCWSTGCFVKLHFTPWDDFIEGFSTVNIQDLAGLCC